MVNHDVETKTRSQNKILTIFQFKMFCFNLRKRKSTESAKKSICLWGALWKRNHVKRPIVFFLIFAYYDSLKLIDRTPKRMIYIH